MPLFSIKSQMVFNSALPALPLLPSKPCHPDCGQLNPAKFGNRFPYGWPNLFRGHGTNNFCEVFGNLIRRAKLANCCTSQLFFSPLATSPPRRIPRIVNSRRMAKTKVSAVQGPRQAWQAIPPHCLTVHRRTSHPRAHALVGVRVDAPL